MIKALEALSHNAMILDHLERSHYVPGVVGLGYTIRNREPLDRQDADIVIALGLRCLESVRIHGCDPAGYTWNESLVEDICGLLLKITEAAERRARGGRCAAA